jgi:dTMP kinase
VSAQRGLLITFEGGEGAGKSTQVQLLRQRLEASGRRVLQLREPGGTPLGEELRQLILNSANLAPKTELLLFLAARSELVQKVTKPALARGIDVICDRFIDSTAAYQGYGLGLDRELIATLNAAAIEGCVPDVTVLLDIEPEVGLARASAESGGDEIEGHWQQGLALEAPDDAEAAKAGKRVGGRDRAFHRKVHKGYQALAKAEPGRWLVLDATQSPEVLGEAVWARTRGLIAARQAS